MLTIYDTFHLVTCEDGILLVSTKTTDEPFILTCNPIMGFVVFHAGYTCYDTRYNVENTELLDFTKMKTYNAEIYDYNSWVVSIPYKNKAIIPNSLYAFKRLVLHEVFTADKFPNDCLNNKNLAILTGIPE